MPRTKEQKQQTIKELANALDKQQSMVFIDFTGLGVKELSAFRKDLREIGAKLIVSKKTLLDRVFKEKKFGVDIQSFTGQLGTIFAFEDSIAAMNLDFKLVQESQESYNEGIQLFEQKKDQDAVSSFDKAIEINPRFYKAYFNRGTASLQLKDYKKAAELGAIINLDDISHIEYLGKNVGLPGLISFRYNPGPARTGNAIIGDPKEAKYGFTREQLIEGYGI
ncbi:50S ribosomal protein L10, partial [Patescibacteria group bacterium]|nr:50S ribosomal protein L10 [Patescibacteria group bacterium]